MDPHINIQSSRKLGNTLIYFCASALTISSGVKLVHPARVVAYMGFLGYRNGTFFLIAALEILAAVLFLFPSTRAGGLLLVSAYFGGAISAHLAHHAFVGGGPFLQFNAIHPFLGTIPASILLMAAWLGVWLRHPEARWSGDMGKTASSSGSL
jgi:DoxX-like protein